jgi:fatty-acyl-CoA synthase
VISTKDAYRRNREGGGAAAGHAHTTEQDIISWCRENMAVYKVPRMVQFVMPCPRAAAAR